jgi:two-component system nitrogen regulation sensor histidine kinase NtrY
MTTATVERPSQRNRLTKRLAQWARQISFERRLAIVLMTIGGLLGVTTLLILNDVWRVGQESGAKFISYLLIGDAVVALALGIIVARRLVLLWAGRRQGLAGARLHARLVLLFGLIAVIPTVVVSVFSTTFLDYGLNTWFSERVRTAIESSLNVTQSYLVEHQQRIGNDAEALANEIRASGIFDLGDTEQLNSMLDRQVNLRGISEAVVFNRSRQVMARGGLSLLMEFNLDVDDDLLLRADSGEIVIVPSSTGDRVRALIALDPQNGFYLYVGRLVDEKVLASVRGNQDAVMLYKQLESSRSGLQITTALIFSALAILLLMAAIWIAIVSASQLVKPLSRLAVAAQKIGGGDLTARVKIGARDDELSALSRTFNVMAIQLQTQQQALVAANRQMDDRRRFTELVLGGVTAGVIGLNKDGRIDLPNRSASELLGINLSEHVGQLLSDLVPEMAPVVERARSRTSGAEDQINLLRGGANRTLHVRVVSEVGEQGQTQLVVTFDDVSELLSAQRKAAWSDIARRIAHEIKNPLTPIQLSAERLKRKYLKQITHDPETFTVCTDTIVRQVGDIGRMVDEFSAFARMPAPVLRPENPAELARQALFLEQSAHPAIEYSVDVPDAPLQIICDASQFTRAVSNLLKNAAESIEGRLDEAASNASKSHLTPGLIHLWITQQDGAVVIGVDDNGRGLPEQDRDRLTEPYVTTRTKGTGLGLAIVKKIMEDHGGHLTLSDRVGGGASIRLSFPTEDPIPAARRRTVEA